MSSQDKDKKTIINTIRDGPLRVSNLDKFYDPKGERIPARPELWLCRCGASKNKPYCNGAHVGIKFSDEKSDDRIADRWKDYRGEKITVHDNRALCSHSGECVRGLPSVFNTEKRPWIYPDGADVKDVVKTVKKCPSGALSYTIDGVRHQEFENKPAITIKKHGPLNVTGGIEFKDEHGEKPASVTRYSLCRCGASKNKPFCDGTHSIVKFRDDGN